MKLKTLSAYVLAASMLSMNVAFATNSNTPPPSSLFSNSWEKMAKSDFYQVSCKKTFGNAKALADSGSGAVAVLDASSPVYKEKMDMVMMGKAKKLKVSMEKVNLFEKLGLVKSDEDFQKVIADPGRKMMSLALANDSFYYNYNGGEGEKTGWKTFLDAKTFSDFFASLSEKNFTSQLNRYSFSFSKWKKAGKARSAIYEGSLTTDSTQSMVEFYVGEEATGYTFEPGKAKLTVDERTGDWVRMDAVATVTSAAAYRFDIKQSCTYNFNKKVKVSLPKNAETVEVESGLDEMGTRMQEF